jgi:rfaE bifunctional protein nucleotidyltransferase chain/domain
LCRRAHDGGQKTALCNGAFELLHVGHVRYLQAAKRLSDVLVVAVNSDRSVRAHKGASRPFIPEGERLEMVRALGVVDCAFLFDSETVEPVLRALRPTFHCKGTDYTENTVPELAVSRQLGIETRIVGDAKDHSTTVIIDRLSRGG